MAKAPKFPVMELFGPTIQGEGALAGTRSHFIRFGGCGYRCNWCDSMHAVDPVQIKAGREMMNAEAITDRIEQINYTKGWAPWVTFTGGDPCMWEHLDLLVPKLKRLEHKINVETQGQLWQDWLDHVDMVTCSPKGPSAGMMDKFDPAVLHVYHARLKPSLVFKVVIMHEEDFEFAKRIHKQFPEVPFYLSVGTVETAISVRGSICRKLKWLSERTLADNAMSDVIVLPQLHVLTWGTELGR